MPHSLRCTGHPLILQSRSLRTLAALALVTGLITAPAAQAQAMGRAGAVPVAPGAAHGEVEIGDRCPTFRWTASPGAEVEEYRLELRELGSANAGPEARGVPMWQVRVPGDRERLDFVSQVELVPGQHYAWTVASQSAGGDEEPAISEPLRFRVALNAVCSAGSAASRRGALDLEVGELVTQTPRAYVTGGTFSPRYILENSNGQGIFMEAQGEGGWLGAIESFPGFSLELFFALLIDGNAVAIPFGLDIGTEADPGLGSGLWVSREVSGSASVTNHSAAIYNNSSSGSADVLALKINEEANSPDFEIGAGNNFISFFDEDDDSLGAIQGDGAGGVTLAGPGNDYAEWLPRLDPAEEIAQGSLVGVYAGQISLRTAGADTVMAVSRGPIVAGGDPGEANRHLYERVAFVGRVVLEVEGPISRGDLVVASGRADGTAVAHAPGEVPLHRLGQVVGQAWEEATGAGLHPVTVLVGLVPPSALAGSMDNAVAELRTRVETQQAELDRLRALEARLAAVEGELSTQRRGGVETASAAAHR